MISDRVFAGALIVVGLGFLAFLFVVIPPPGREAAYRVRAHRARECALTLRYTPDTAAALREVRGDGWVGKWTCAAALTADTARADR